MRKRTLPALGLTVAAAGVIGAALAMSPATAGAATAGPRTVTFEAVEKGTSVNFVDVAPSDSALGDQLIGTGDLVGADGRTIGTSSFQGISTDAKPRTAEMLTFVYDLGDGNKITTSGTARLNAKGPVFDEQFAITGGTGKYKNARGQVRVLQETVEQAKVTFDIQL
ncbi:allene oxide cyclase barrel-like domain-containing protein [Streptomyces sp. URMC 127]|uniref:allene oxide cyclase barrel-like domain-containing protein n=1 Tax=Streptomyces sp. URMC 127 TaxID=3423402 RepID=UPI003F1C43A0